MKSNFEGRLNYDHLVALVKDGKIKTIHLTITDFSGRLAGSQRFPAAKLLEMGDKISLSSDRICFGLDGFVVLNNYSPVEMGCRNHISQIDYEHASWSWFPEEAVAFYEFLHPKSLLPYSFCPRVLLKKFIDNFFYEGLEIRAGSKMDFYLLERVAETSYEFSVKDCRPLWPNHGYCDSRLSNRIEPVLKEIRETCRRAGVYLEASHLELGPGQIGVQISDEEVLRTCDSQVKLREIVKSVAYNNKMHATFMSKLWKDFPGNGCHFQISIWNRLTNQNLFAGDDFLLEEETGLKCSNTLLFFIGGLINYLKEVFPMLAQFVNSYKRFRQASFAPRGFGIWGYNNPFAAFSILGEGPSLRVEVRVAGGDVNPYWGYSAALACGLRGVKEKVLPPPMSKGDGPGKEMAFPKSLKEATEYFENSKIAAELLGEEIKEFALYFLHNEISAFEDEITEWEQNRYFDKF